MMRHGFMVLLLALVGCGPNFAPHPTTPVTPRPNGGPIQQIELCRDSMAIGYWLSDCSTQWCLPVHQAQVVYSVNAGLLVAYTADSFLPAYVATQEPERRDCGPGIIPWRVWRTKENRDFLGANRFMIDPVRACSGTVCNQPIMDGWAVSNEYLLYFLDEVFSSEISGQS